MLGVLAHQTPTTNATAGSTTYCTDSPMPGAFGLPRTRRNWSRVRSRATAKTRKPTMTTTAMPIVGSKLNGA